jgi:hypothetical protein
MSHFLVTIPGARGDWEGMPTGQVFRRRSQYGIGCSYTMIHQDSLNRNAMQQGSGLDGKAD